MSTPTATPTAPRPTRRPHRLTWPTVALAAVIGVTLVGLAVAGRHEGPAPTGDTSPVTTPSPAQPPAAAPVLHPADVIDRLRKQGEFTVTAVHPLDGARLYVTEGLEATITDPADGTSSTAVIATFGNANGRDAYQISLISLGGAVAVGTGERPQDLWGVNLWGPVKPADGPALADKIAHRLGGTIRPVASPS